MVCYQVSARFVFQQHKPVLVSVSTKKQEAKSFLVLIGLPFGHGLKYSRFFKTEKAAFGYVAYLNTVYKNCICPNPACSGGQLALF
ncbi:hypothetical protein AGMMS50268_28720 [Spirochaetia bacterium]|nr:hypothetical protein AGMMS50268_28720 [Spirochaetia bacterium]